jgi:hypothetical protein
MRIALEMRLLPVLAAAQIDGLLRQRFSPPRRSTVCFGISMPFSAMNMRTMRGLGPIES